MKKNEIDAIYDTVNEMARDEARYGKALEGLLNRYFKVYAKPKQHKAL